jgi:hypothetical protein
MFSWSICGDDCHIIRCIESDSSWGYVGIKDSCGNNVIEEEQWAKPTQAERDNSSYIEKESLEKSQNRHSTAELNILNSWRACLRHNCPTRASQIPVSTTRLHPARLLYFWGFYPVAYLSNWFFMTPSVATKLQYINSI